MRIVGAAVAELRLDLRGEDLAENIRPAVVRDNSQPMSAGACRERLAIRLRAP